MTRGALDQDVMMNRLDVITKGIRGQKSTQNQTTASSAHVKSLLIRV